MKLINKFKNYILKFIIVAVVISFFTIFVYSFINKSTAISFKIADSGHGVSHHSSGGHSSSHSSSSSGSRVSLADSDVSPGVIAVIVIFPITVIVVATICGILLGRKRGINNINEDEIINKIKVYIPNFDKQKFLDEGYKIYIDVQNAWMTFKLDNVRNVITDEMYNMYDAQLEIMKAKDEQNVMSDFDKINSCVKNVVVQNNTIAITAVYVIDFYDYIINMTSGKVVSGTSTRKLRVTYEMTYRKSLVNNEKIGKCPNCGGKTEEINGVGICKYCGSKIVQENSKWVLTNKKVINQI